MTPYGLKSPETRLLLDCCRGGEISLGAGATAPDWTHLAQRATASGLGALVYTSLKRRADMLPPEALQRLRAAYMAPAAGNLRLLGALGRLLRQIGTREIPVMLLKGTALVALVYRDPALRPMGDADLLIRRQDIPMLVNIMAECDMIPAAVPMSVEEYDREHHHWIPYVARDGSLAVELHFDLVPPAKSIRPCIEDIWAAASSGAIGGVAVLVPSLEHLLLHLTIHVCSSPPFEPPLRGLYDMAQTIRVAGAGIDWDGFVAAAEKWNAARQAWCGLTLAQDWMSADIPPPVLARLEKACRFRLGERAALLRVSRFLALRPTVERGPAAVQERIFDLVVEPGSAGAKLLSALKVVWDELQISARAAMPGLPRWALPFYAAFLHPFFLLARRGSP
ncbi:MAG TPA: nucleotidyltransferase family protein [Rhizomicrobium sp.]|nr:nucleotidyltransferase family protein [Rhizomicrobium sp.]